MIPLTIFTTKRVNTCLIPSAVSWRIQAKKMDPCTSFCSKRACDAFFSGLPFGTQKPEELFVVIYFGMRCSVPEPPKAVFRRSCSPRAHNQTSKCGKEPRSSNRRLYFLSHPMAPSKPLKNNINKWHPIKHHSTDVSFLPFHVWVSDD